MSFTPRIYLNVRITVSDSIQLDVQHSNYLLRVLRLRSGEIVKVFNELDGEFECKILNGAQKLTSTKHICTLKVIKQLRTVDLDLHQKRAKLSLAFAPTKGLGASFVVQKACELGVYSIHPILTKRSVIKSINLDKLQKIAIEAAEQSERLDVPTVHPIESFDLYLASILDCNVSKKLQIVFCYERAKSNLLSTLSGENDILLIIGPEGGFDDSEYWYVQKLINDNILKNKRVEVLISKIHDNILKSETAVISALAVVQQFCS